MASNNNVTNGNGNAAEKEAQVRQLVMVTLANFYSSIIMNCYVSKIGSLRYYEYVLCMIQSLTF